MQLSDFQDLFTKNGIISTLDFGDEGEFCAKATVWGGDDVDINIMYAYEDEDPDYALFATHAGKLEKRLRWLEDNKLLIVQYLMQNTGEFDHLNEQIAQNGKITIDGQDITCPITDTDVSNAAKLITVQFWLIDEDDVGDECLGCEISLKCEPDFLYGHIAVMEIGDDDELFGIAIDG